MDNQTFTYQIPTQQKQPKKAFPILRVIFIILAIIILIEVVIGLKTLLTPVRIVKKPVETTAPISGGQILLSSPKQSYQLGDTVAVDVNISTGGHSTEGVDLVIKYDPSKLEASSSGFIKGNTYDDYPVMNIDPDKGILRISGIVSISRPGFIGNGNFGTINFKAKSAGSSDVALDFSSGSTNDSNMVEVGNSQDILSNVSNVKINIQ